MTDTIITVPDYVTMIDRDSNTLPALAQIGVDLLVQAEYRNLPAPGYLRISHGGQSISLGFGRDLAALRALAQWSGEFGGTVTGSPHQGSDGCRQVYCEVGFIYGGVKVELYALIKPNPAATT